MPLKVSDLLIRVQAETGGAVSALGALSLGMAGLTVGVGAAAAAMVKMGVDSQNQLAIVQGLTGASAAQMGQYTAGLEKMATTLGLTMTEGAKGLYYVVSAGFQGADALKVLTYATEEAKASGADLASTADGLTSALNAYNAKANEAGKYSDIMITAVTYGKQTFGDFSSSIGQAALMASTAHIPFQQLAAAESALTEKGLPAHQAMTNLSFLISKIALDTPTTAAAVRKLGGSFDEAKYSSLDLMGKIAYLRNETGLSTAEFVKLVGGTRSAKAALGLLADGGAAYNLILSKMKGEGEKTAAAFKVHDATMQGAFEDLAGAVSVLANRLVTMISPVLIPTIQNLGKVLLDLFTNFEKYKPYVLGIAAAIVTFLAPALYVAAAAAWTAAIGFIALNWPLLLIAAAVALVVIGIVLLVQHWSQVVAWLQSVWNPAWKAVSTFFVGVWNGMVNAVTGAWRVISDYVSVRVNAIAALFTGIWQLFLTRSQQTHDAIVNVFQTIATFFVNIWTTITTNIQTAWNNVVTWLTQRATAVQNALSGPFNWFAGFFGGLWKVISDIGRVGLEILIRLIQDEMAGFLIIWHFAWDPIAKFVGTVWQAISTTITKAVQAEWALIVTVWNAVTGWLRDTWNTIARGAAVIWDVISKVVGTYIDIQWAKVTSVWNTVTTYIQGVWKTISGLASAAWSVISKSISDYLTQQQKNIGDVWSGIQSFIGGTWDKIVSTAQGVWKGLTTFIQSQAKTLQDAIMAPFIWARDHIGGILKGMANFGIDVLNNDIKAFALFINDFGGAINWIAKALGVKDRVGSWSPPLIGHLATGTDNWSGGWAWVGERGPELAFLPKGASVVPNDQATAIATPGKTFPGFAGGLGSILDWISGALGDILKWASGGAGSLLQTVLSKIPLPQIGGDLAGLAGGAVNTITGRISGTVQNWLNGWLQQNPAGGGSGTGGTGGTGGFRGPFSGSLTGWIQSAMGLTNAPGNWMGALATIAMHESGGNPAAINNWDSNARAGHPSEGLFQTIMATFLANAIPGHGNIWNPVDNASAAIGYIRRRYGNVFNVPGIVSLSHGGAYVGYADGGWINEPIAGIGLASGRGYAFGERGPEYVSPTGRGAGANSGDTYHIYVTTNDQAAIADEIVRKQRWHKKLHG